MCILPVFRTPPFHLSAQERGGAQPGPITEVTGVEGDRKEPAKRYQIDYEEDKEMAYLRVYEGDVLRDQQELTTDRISIGRANDNDIVLDSQGVSGHHAVIERERGSFVLIDKGSANGVFVNGQRIERHTLAYWEEIQIYNYAIKFMQHAKLPGEQEGELSKTSAQDEIDATMVMDVSRIRDLVNLKKQKNEAKISLLDAVGGLGEYPLNKASFTIGKSSDCDITLGGWWTPGVAARIQRRNNDYYVVPSWRGRVRINGRPVSKLTQLTDGDQLEVRSVPMVFHVRNTG